MSKKLTVLVAGATGNQGGRVASMLLKKGHKVVALTRTPSSPAAQNLLDLGAKVVVGDLTDIASLQRAAKGVDAIFGVTTFTEAGTQVEVTQGINLANVAHEVGAHFIFSSVGSANKETGIPHFNSKWEVEKHILQSRVDYTIVGPVYFMENLLNYGIEGLKKNIYASPLTPERKLAQICLDDLANFVVLAFENRLKFIRKRIDIASDDLTGTQVADVLSQSFGRPIQYVQIPMDDIKKQSSDLALMFEWFEKTGYEVDTISLRDHYPEVHWHSFEQWVKRRSLSERVRPPRAGY